MRDYKYNFFSDRVAGFRDFFYEKSDVVELGLVFLVLKYAYCNFEEGRTANEFDLSPRGEKYLVPNFFEGGSESFFYSLKDFSKKVDVLYFDSWAGLVEVLEAFVLKGVERSRVLVLLCDVFRGLIEERDLSKSLIGELFEVGLKELYDARGLIGSEFYTPRDVVDFMVRLIAPAPGESVYDPVCGSAGFLVYSDQFSSVNSSRGDSGVSLYGRDRYEAVARLAKWNLFVHGCKKFSVTVGDSLVERLDRKFDVVLANPPFSVKNWNWSAFLNSRDAVYGQPPKSNADYAFLQHVISSLNDGGRAAVIVPSGVLFRGGSEKEIRKRIINDGLVDAIVSLPSGVFKNTSVSLCIMFLDKRSRNGPIFFAKSADRSGNEKGAGVVVDELQILFELCRDRKEISGLSALVSSEYVAENDYDLNFLRYIKSGEVAGRKLAEIFVEYSSLEERLRVLQDEMNTLVRDSL